MDEQIMITNPELRHILDFLEEMKEKLADPDQQIKTSTGDWFEQMDFQGACNIFNRRLQKKPWVIVYCRTEDDVQNTYKCATGKNLPIRIRAGGHDHEGECTGTNTILIDVSEMDWVEVDENGLARIGPGNIFKNLTTKLAAEGVMIPHGTCATVGISGFTMGGGWGPWTRKEGMCCERLVGANMVLGDGSKISVDADENGVPSLLWALRGGGGMSYGLVTELRIQTFKLPKVLVRFEIEWNPYPEIWRDLPSKEYPTIDVVKAWERVITSTQTSQLIGTNLKVNGQPAQPSKAFDVNNVYHNCVMYGYWEGTEKELKTFIKEKFASVAVPDAQIKINHHHGGTDPNSKEEFGEYLMSNWARESNNKIVEALHQRQEVDLVLTPEQSDLLDQGKPLPPDYDDPAPHKITSRLVDQKGLGDEGHKAMIQSLTSPLILKGNRQLGLFTYVTLGAIVGDYYHKNPFGADSAFPYKDKQYTIQYQTWWNLETYQQLIGQNSKVNNRTNRALDWMEVARDYDIPNTSGAFISFKDSSIPTKTYFAQNYEQLKYIKENFSKDPLNHFRIRKSII